MRKIHFAIIVILSLVMINFCAWFAHTRAIKNTIAFIQDELRVYHLHLTYDDIHFPNFFSLKTQAVITKPMLKFKLPTLNNGEALLDAEATNAIDKAYIGIEKLEIVSDVLSSKAELSLKEIIGLFGYKSKGVKVLTLHHKGLKKLLTSDCRSLVDCMTGNIRSLLLSYDRSEVFDSKGEFFAMREPANSVLKISQDESGTLYDFESEGGHVIYNKTKDLGALQEKPALDDSKILWRTNDMKMKLKHRIKADEDDIGSVYDGMALQIEGLGASSSHGAINIDGHISHGSGSILPSGNFNLSFQNYRQIIDSQLDALKLLLQEERTKYLMQQKKEKRAKESLGVKTDSKPSLKDSLSDGIFSQAFTRDIEKLSIKTKDLISFFFGNDKDLKLEIKSTDDGLSINEYSISSLMAKFDQWNKKHEKEQKKKQVASH